MTEGPTYDQHKLADRALRAQVPRSAHEAWQAPDDRPDPIELLEENNRPRLPDLVPVRYGRMLASPFAFLRGSAVIMTSDLASTPGTGLRVQAGGDAHLGNFGVFGTVNVEDITDGRVFEDPGMVSRVTLRYKSLQSEALPQGASQELIEEWLRNDGREPRRNLAHVKLFGEQRRPVRRSRRRRPRDGCP
jgi:hypothetical protein